MKSDERYLREIYKKYDSLKTKNGESEFYHKRVKQNSVRVLKMVATFVLAMGVMIGIVYAGVVTYQENSIWKDPKQLNMNREVPEEEKKQCITEDEAERFGNEYLKMIGLSDDTISSFQLVKEFFSDRNEWNLYSQKASVRIDGKTGELKSIQVPTWNYRIPYNYGISRVEAREVAKQLFEKYKPKEDQGEYELVKLTRNMETDEASYIWYSQFVKKYGDFENPYEEINIAWIPTINAIYQISIERGVYENNEQVITKEQAIQIAKEKDQKIGVTLPIKNIQAEVGIEQLNSEAYLREKNQQEYDSRKSSLEQNLKNGTYYQAEERVRKVWYVVIDYDTNDQDIINQFTYYIDATTGEVIGGAICSPLERNKTIQQDPYNLIEK